MPCHLLWTPEKPSPIDLGVSPFTRAASPFDLFSNRGGREASLASGPNNNNNYGNGNNENDESPEPAAAASLLTIAIRSRSRPSRAPMSLQPQPRDLLLMIAEQRNGFPPVSVSTNSTSNSPSPEVDRLRHRHQPVPVAVSIAPPDLPIKKRKLLSTSNSTENDLTVDLDVDLKVQQDLDLGFVNGKERLTTSRNSSTSKNNKSSSSSNSSTSATAAVTFIDIESQRWWNRANQKYGFHQNQKKPPPLPPDSGKFPKTDPRSREYRAYVSDLCARFPEGAGLFEKLGLFDPSKGEFPYPYPDWAGPEEMEKYDLSRVQEELERKMSERLKNKGREKKFS